jgi:very-short-patch-repair endonuclease
MGFDWEGDAGVFLTRELLAAGYDDRTIAYMVRTGQWHRIRRGAFVYQDVWRDMDAVGRHRLTARAVLKTAHPTSVLTHTSAIVEYGAPVWNVSLDEVHLTRTDGCPGRREAGVVHHCGKLGESEVTLANGLRVSDAARAVVELSTMADVESCLVSGNWLLGTGMISPEELTRTSQRFQFWPGTLQKHVLGSLFDGRSRWPGEARASFLMWREHIPKPEPQFEVINAQGNLVGIVDFAWPEFGVFLEFDGAIKYERLRRTGETLEDVILREKRRQEQICLATGWTCIRITWEDLAKPTTTARRIRQILEGRAAYAS